MNATYNRLGPRRAVSRGVQKSVIFPLEICSKPLHIAQNTLPLHGPSRVPVLLLSSSHSSSPVLALLLPVLLLLCLLSSCALARGGPQCLGGGPCGFERNKIVGHENVNILRRRVLNFLDLAVNKVGSSYWTT